MLLNDQVRAFWEAGVCGTDEAITGTVERHSPAWFREVEAHRYAAEPMIHAVAQFTRHAGRRLLEIGVGAGTDHLQWARAGAECHGVDLTEAAIETTRRHLALHGLESRLQRIDAETLPFAPASFDLVYSWGVIHHSEHPERIVAEIHRALRPGGQFLGMVYNRRSVVALKLWARHALMAGRPWRSLGDVLCHHVESVGTKGYTPAELRRLFGAFRAVAIEPYLTPYDLRRLPAPLAACLPPRLGWFLAVRATR